MAFEQRSTSGLYMYLSYRDPVSGQVKKRYFGRGPRADAATAAVARRREQREADRRAADANRSEYREQNGLLDEVNAAAALLMEAVLLAAGFHRPNHGPWRKRREPR